MRRIVFLAILAFNFQILCAQKTYKLTYKVQESPFKKGEFKTELRIKNDLAQYAYFRRPNSFKEDNISMNISHLKYLNNYNLNSGSITEQRTLENGVLLKAVWTPDYRWEIKDEFRIINGYRVQMAVGKSIELPEESPYYYGKVRAWFTTDIPVSAGPARYSGLPGLILELEYQKFGGKITLEKIEKNINVDIVDVSKGNVVEKEDVIYFNHKNPETIKKLKKI